MKLSIIIAVYNIEKYIAKCLDSVIKQKGDDIEIIIINDGSTDKSLKICEKYQKKDARIRIISEENKGLNTVRNVGYDNSRGEYIWHIDGDDYINEYSVDILRKYFGIYDIVYFNYNRIINKKIEKVNYDRKYDNDIDNYILGNIGVWNKIYKREVFNNNRFPDGCIYDDIYIVPSLVCSTNKIIFIDDYLYSYVYRNNSLSNTTKFNINEWVYCLDNVYNKLSKDYPVATECFYINQLLVYKYADEIRTGRKCHYRKYNTILKEKYPNYYKNKYYNNSLAKKIYIRLVYYNCITIVKLMTFFKLKVYNKLKKIDD